MIWITLHHAYHSGEERDWEKSGKCIYGSLLCHVFPFTSSALCYRYRFTIFHIKNDSMMSAVSQAWRAFARVPTLRRLSDKETPSRCSLRVSQICLDFNIIRANYLIVLESEYTYISQIQTFQRDPSIFLFPPPY